MRPLLGMELPDHSSIYRAGDSRQPVKIVFADETGIEKMWVTPSDTSDDTEWVGELDSSPTHIPLETGDEVRFHPLDVIDIFEGA
jgi:hypothetical protein